MIRLQELNDRPETTIRVLPFSTGAHPALTGQFAILDFPEDARIRPQVFCDGLTGGVLRDKPDEVERYRACFIALEKLTLDVQESAKFFAAVIEGVLITVAAFLLAVSARAATAPSWQTVPTAVARSLSWLKLHPQPVCCIAMQTINANAALSTNCKRQLHTRTAEPSCPVLRDDLVLLSSCA